MYKKPTNPIKRGLSALLLSAVTFWGVISADAQIVIDGHFADWDGINAATVDDAKDMADTSGDIGGGFSMSVAERNHTYSGSNSCFVPRNITDRFGSAIYNVSNPIRTESHSARVIESHA